MTDDLRDAIRAVLLRAMSHWSEETYAAGWLIDLEARLHHEAGVWEHVGRAVGWPIGPEAEDGWETWDQAAARYSSLAWLDARPWLRRP